MTAPDELDPLYTFLRALPPSSSRQLNRTTRLYTLVNAAVRDHGWTPVELAEHCGRNHAGAVNHAGIVMHRLEDAASRDPELAEGPRKVHHGCCENGLIYHVPDDPRADVTATKCPGRTTT